MDPEDDSISLLDAFYYSTVTITTTGYGDVRPVTDEARLVTTIIVTPARVLFLILLVGTTLEILAERSRRLTAGHAGGGAWTTTRSSAATGPRGGPPIGTLLGKGATAEQIVVIDERSDAASAAKADGYAVVIGDASNRATLEAGGDRRARSVVVAVDRDDAAVLVDAHRPRAEPSGRRSSPRCARRRTCTCSTRAAPTRRHLFGRRRAAARAVDRDAADHRAARGPAHRSARASTSSSARSSPRRPGRPRAAADATRCCSPSSATAS